MYQIYDEDEEIIEGLKKVIDKNFIGKRIEILFNDMLFIGTLLYETKNTFVMLVTKEIKIEKDKLIKELQKIKKLEKAKKSKILNRIENIINDLKKTKETKINLALNELNFLFSIISTERIKSIMPKKEVNERRTFIKNSIKFRIIDEMENTQKENLFLPAAYFTQPLDERLRLKVEFHKNPLLSTKEK